MAKAYKQVSQVVKETGLLGRTQWFYVFVAAGLAVALGGLITGFILLGRQLGSSCSSPRDSASS